MTAFERALTQPSLITPSDRMSYAQALARVNRTRDALAQFALVSGPLAGQAAYQRARVYLTSRHRRSTALGTARRRQSLSQRHGAAASALYLLADLSTDDGNDDQARTLYQQLYRELSDQLARGVGATPRVDHRARAGTRRRPRPQASTRSSRYPRSEEVSAARYWSGRAYADAGDNATARLRWRDAVSTQLGQLLRHARRATSSAKSRGCRRRAPTASRAFPAIDSALARIALLEQLGMDTEAKFELDALDDAATSSPERIAATAHAFVTHGQPSRAIRLAQKLIDAGQRDARAYRLLYPLVDGDELERSGEGERSRSVARRGAHSTGVELQSARGVGRERARFDAGAAVGRARRSRRRCAFRSGIRRFCSTPTRICNSGPRISRHTCKQYGTLPRVLAAYNAGGSRVTRWATKTGMDDAELFVERIPFVETRDYVRIVQRNADVYRHALRRT